MKIEQGRYVPHLTASVRQANVQALPLLVAKLEPAADWCGYTPSLFGSVQRYGSGRDFDFFFVPTRVIPHPDEGEGVASRLAQAGMIVLTTERGSGRFGIVGTLDGYALDITVLERHL